MYGTDQCEAERVEHGPLVAAIAAFLRPRVYVELGVHRGETFKLVEPHCSEVAFGIDIDGENVRHCVSNHTTSKAVFACTTSVDWLTNHPDASIDLAFLDSSHKFEQTIEECTLLHAKVRTNGVILLHDAYPPNDEQMQPDKCGQVYRAISIIKQNLGWEGMTLPAQYGLALFRKHGGKQLLWR